MAELLASTANDENLIAHRVRYSWGYGQTHDAKAKMVASFTNAPSWKKQLLMKLFAFLHNLSSVNGASSVRGIPRIYGVYPVNLFSIY